MEFRRVVEFSLAVFAEEALLNLFGTRDEVTQLWPTVAPFLTPLGFSLGLAALSMYLERWTSDCKEWRKERKAAQKEEALSKLDFLIYLDLTGGPISIVDKEKMKVVRSELREMGLIKKKEDSSSSAHERICRA